MSRRRRCSPHTCANSFAMKSAATSTTPPRLRRRRGHVRDLSTSSSRAGQPLPQLPRTRSNRAGRGCSASAYLFLADYRQLAEVIVAAIEVNEGRDPDAVVARLGRRRCRHGRENLCAGCRAPAAGAACSATRPEHADARRRGDRCWLRRRRRPVRPPTGWPRCWGHARWSCATTAAHRPVSHRRRARRSPARSVTSAAAASPALATCRRTSSPMILCLRDGWRLLHWRACRSYIVDAGCAR